MKLNRSTREMYEEIIIDGLNAHPRSAQKMIGPSEVGESCDRKIALKLAGTELEQGEPSWQAWVGTQAHEGMAKNFEMENARLVASGDCTEDNPRYLIESRVSVGWVGDRELTGSSDLFDSWENMVVDWKFPGAKKMAKLQKAAAEGDYDIEDGYYIQAQCYGRGQENVGRKVEKVCIAYLPASGKLEEAVWQVADYDRQVSEDVLERLNRIQAVLDDHPDNLAAAITKIRTNPDIPNFCPWCPYFTEEEDYDPATQCRGAKIENAAKLATAAPSNGLTFAPRIKAA